MTSQCDHGDASSCQLALTVGMMSARLLEGGVCPSWPESIAGCGAETGGSDRGGHWSRQLLGIYALRHTVCDIGDDAAARGVLGKPALKCRWKCRELKGSGHKVIIVGGREESGIGWREKLGCGAVSTEVSSSPYGGSESGMALQTAPS